MMFKTLLLGLAVAVSAVTAQQFWNVAGTKALVKEFEGLRLTAYICPAGVLTIGWGHTGPDVYSGQTITVAQAETFLDNDLQKFAFCVGS